MRPLPTALKRRTDAPSSNSMNIATRRAHRSIGPARAHSAPDGQDVDSLPPADAVSGLSGRIGENAHSPWRCRLDYFLVTELPGPSWDHSRPRREQPGWDEHATFIDGLVERGVIVLGGPLGDPDFGPALLVFGAESENEVHEYLSADPWLDTVLHVETVERWSIWIGSLA